MFKSFKKILEILDFSGKKTKRNFFIMVFFVSIGAIFDVLGISMIVPLISTIIPSSGNDPADGGSFLLDFLNNLSQQYDLSTLLIILVMIFFIKASYTTTLYYIQSVFCFNAQASLSEKLALKYLSSQPEIFYSNDSSEYIRNCIQETDQFNFSVLISLFSLVAEIVVIIFMLSLLMFLDWKTSLIVMAMVAILSYAFVMILRKPLDDSGTKRQFHFGLRLKVLREAIDGFKELSISSAAPLFLQDYKKHNRKGNKANYQAHWMSQLPRMWIEFFAVMSIFLSVYIVINSGSSGSQVITIIGVFAAAAVRLMPSASRVMGSINYLIYSTTVINMLFDEVKKDISSQVYKNTNVTDKSKIITINSGKYIYESNKNWGLDISDFSIDSDNKIAIFGESGSGKTTLLDVLSGFKILSSGDINISIDEDISFISDYWRYASYCGQSVFIFDKNLDYNITMNENNIDYDRLTKVKEISGLTDLEDKINNRKEKSLGEIGGNLSGGQRQRVGIARALYKKSTRISFFDEVTSNLDSDLAHKIIPNVLKWNKEKAVVFVSHDTSLAQYFDIVYRVKDGVIHREK